jgi:hypothetical protein
MRITTLPAAIAIVTMLSASPALAGPTVVNCAPGQRAVVSNDFVRGERVTRIACVGGRSRQRSQARYRAVRHRTWGQRALVIGGSAGTGAGIGGIVNGGRGALIGGALGGGVASLIEGTRRR